MLLGGAGTIPEGAKRLDATGGAGLGRATRGIHPDVRDPGADPGARDPLCYRGPSDGGGLVPVGGDLQAPRGFGLWKRLIILVSIGVYDA